MEKQDAIGMIPALLLNIEPHHKVISVCCVSQNFICCPIAFVARNTRFVT